MTLLKKNQHGTRILLQYHTGINSKELISLESCLPSHSYIRFLPLSTNQIGIKTTNVYNFALHTVWEVGEKNY